MCQSSDMCFKGNLDVICFVSFWHINDEGKMQKKLLCGAEAHILQVKAEF